MKHIGTAQNYADLATLARVARDAAEDMYTLALSIGEIGTAVTAEEARKDFARIAAVMPIRADEARLVGGELRIQTVHDRAAIITGRPGCTAGTRSMVEEVLADLERGA